MTQDKRIQLFHENMSLIEEYKRDNDMYQSARLGLWLACLRWGVAEDFRAYAEMCIKNELRSARKGKGNK